MYDLALPSDTIELAPADGEAESFELLGRAAIVERMHRGEFKPNCTLGTSTYSHSLARLFRTPRLAYCRERAGLYGDCRTLAHAPPSSYAVARSRYQ